MPRFIDRLVDALPFTPNADQSAALGDFDTFMNSPGERTIFILRGYAGTGKSNLLSAMTRALPSFGWKTELLAPTGRAAKVLSGYSGKSASTIHRKIFRKVQGETGQVLFVPADNPHRKTLFIVDEASMIAAGRNQDLDVLENLLTYVFSGDTCKLLLCGDTAQLPPVGSDVSPALDPDYLQRVFHLDLMMSELKEVARQKTESMILYNATQLRIILAQEQVETPKLYPGPDVIVLPGDELEDAIHNSMREFGEENVIIITRSNKRAKLFNQSYRQRVRQMEDDLCSGDRLMVVKNNYYWLGEGGDFIANGDMMEVMSIRRREELYGFNFCECTVRFPEHEGLPVQQVKIITDCLNTDAPALTEDQQSQLYQSVLEDVQDEPSRALRAAYLRKSPHYNALQVKFSYAVTCHKAQGGQWPVVFIDHGYLTEEMVSEELIRWLYTALTRAMNRVYLINFSPLLLANARY